MLGYCIKIYTLFLLWISCYQAVSFSAGQNSHFISVYCIILFSLEISCAFLLFTHSGGKIRKSLGWLFAIHGIYPLSMVFISGLHVVVSENRSVLLFVLIFIGGAFLLLTSSPITVAEMHDRRDRYLPVLFFLTYLPGSLLTGMTIRSDGPANEAGLLLGVILSVMTFSIVWRKAIALVVHILALFSVAYIVGYTMVIPSQSGSFPVFLIFPALFVISYIWLTISDRRKTLE